MIKIKIFFAINLIFVKTFEQIWATELNELIKTKICEALKSSFSAFFRLRLTSGKQSDNTMRQQDYGRLKKE